MNTFTLNGQVSLIFSNIFMCTNQNQQELVSQKFKTHIKIVFTHIGKTLILGNIFMCINENLQELLSQKFKNLMITILIVFSCELVRTRKN